MAWLIDIFKKAIDNKFNGSITVNFFSGGITNVNVNESIKPTTKINIVVGMRQ